jgi:hypothetical protein
MIRNLSILGVCLVILGGSLTAISNPSASAVDSQQQSDNAEREPTVEAEPTSTPEPEKITNREDCREIRGTDYLSRQERTWFLDNCVTR